MKNKGLKISVVILLIITLTMTNFIFLGSSLISYAVDDISTNHKNIEFSAYFKNDQGEKVTSLDRTASTQEIWLYMSISVKKEGFFNGQVELTNSNFNIASSESEYVSKIEGNKVYLNQINAGTTAEIELKAKTIENESVDLNKLSAESEVTLTGIYRDSTEKDIEINAVKNVVLNLIETNTADSIENSVAIVTNKVLKIAGEDKILGVNIMVAMKNYAETVRECVKQKIDLIISGAGIPKELPEYVKGTKTKIAPIVSSLRCCKLIVKHWISKYNYIPDMIVVEGTEAGGHLGFKQEELVDGNKPKLEDITLDVVNYIKEVEKENGKQIPVIAAGGIWDGKDINRFLDLGADGVQMATRFVATEECDASENFKQAYINANKEDIKIIKSPVGMPGRAIYNEFIKTTEMGKCKIEKCYNCIKTCNVVNTPYCITKALINAVKGNMNEALIFCGSNVEKVKKIVSVHNLMDELVNGIV